MGRICSSGVRRAQDRVIFRLRVRVGTEHRRGFGGTSPPGSSEVSFRIRVTDHGRAIHSAKVGAWSRGVTFPRVSGRFAARDHWL